MKKEKLIYLGLTFLILLLTLSDNNIFLGEANSKKIYNLVDLKLTRIDMSCEVYLTKGENKKLIIEAPENIIKKINTSEENGILTIGMPIINKFFGLIKIKNNEANKVKIFVNHDQLDRIIVSDQAKIISLDYKPMSYQASVEQSQNKGFRNLNLSLLRLTNVGLIDLAAFIVSG